MRNNNQIFISRECSELESQYIGNQINKYNLSTSPTKQDPPSESINLTIKNERGDVLGGILGRYYRFALYIHVLWISEELRGKGYGSRLLNEIERIAIEKGCKLVHLDTWDFQAPEFYKNHGFEVFGVLDGFPEGTKRYFLKKAIC